MHDKNQSRGGGSFKKGSCDNVENGGWRWGVGMGMGMIAIRIVK